MRYREKQGERIYANKLPQGDVNKIPQVDANNLVKGRCRDFFKNMEKLVVTNLERHIF